MIVRRRVAPGLAALLCSLAVVLPAMPGIASPPSPLAPSLFAFPGAAIGPASAASAGLALADRWLGEEPFSNPAVAPGLRLTASPTMQRVSRQDLRADNRNFDETAAFFDGAGLAVGLPGLGRLGVALYAFQPVLRFEDHAYSRGRSTPDPDNPPAVVQTHASARETRAGLAASSRLGPGRIGVGLEWTRRADVYEVVEQSGDPLNAGTKRLELSGDGLSVQAGARLDRGDSAAGAFALGLAARYLPALAVDAPHTEALLTGTTDETLHAERASGWELGGTARVVVRPALRVFAAAGGRTAQRWEGFDLRAGRAWEWKLACEYHDVRDPWTFRFGLGQEFQSAVPDPRASVLGLGFGWQFSDATVDVGVVHRTLAHDPKPNSFDDRVVFSLRVPR
jgi:hypothetical protein